MSQVIEKCSSHNVEESFKMLRSGSRSLWLGSWFQRRRLARLDSQHTTHDFCSDFDDSNDPNW